jgi:Zn-dependent protease
MMLFFVVMNTVCMWPWDGSSGRFSDWSVFKFYTIFVIFPILMGVFIMGVNGDFQNN